MAISDEAESARRRPSVKAIAILLVLVILVVLSALALVTIGNITQVPPSTFVNMPTTPLSTQGESMMLVSIGTVFQKGVAVGAKANLETMSGQPVVGAKVYVQYFFNGAYRIQVGTTGQNGYLEIHFPMNWDGSLPVTFTYLGDNQHQGFTLRYSLPGEGP
jgi:hypothetical protein